MDKVMVNGVVDQGVMKNGRIISSKPPVLPLIMTAEFIFLRSVFGLELGPPGDSAVRGVASNNTDTVIRIVCISLMCVSYGVTIVFAAKTISLFGVATAARVFLVAAIALGTQLFSYAPLITNHVPAAAFLMGAVYLAMAMSLGAQPPTRGRMLAFGFAAGMVAAIDIPMTIFPAAAGLILLKRHPYWVLTWAVPAAALPVFVQSGVLLVVTGSPLPVQMRPETYMYENAYWRHPLGIDALAEPKLAYAFHITFGRNGLFLLFPVLLLGPIGTIVALIRGEEEKGILALLLAAFGILTLYYVIKTNNYGGESYGFRWFIAAMPVLLIMAVPAVRRLSKPWHWALPTLMLLVSFYSSFESTLAGWESNREWTVKTGLFESSWKH